jgi:cysteinyl-tRNA synthetase
MLTLFNSLARHKENFIPIDESHIRMYVCGPTVYDIPHIGNARSAVVYDMLFRLLKQLYPKVTYARNITDVDDKINKAAKEKNISIQTLATAMTEKYHSDMQALNILTPTFEPKATENIPQIIAMIEKLIANDNAYVSDNHVLFSVESFPEYGKLSGRDVDDMIAGSRVEIASYKKNPADFVLWKPASQDDDSSSIFDSPWSKGRPGWHIECSAMSVALLGEDFDIHGGGADLTFPHHENEIAQSRCANPNSHYAKYWIHNGFLTVNGEKMSKSLNNFITVRELLDQGINGNILRFIFLSTHYRKPLDYNDKIFSDAKKALVKFSMVFSQNAILEPQQGNEFILPEIIEALSDDINTPLAISHLHNLTKEIHKNPSKEQLSRLLSSLDFLGINARVEQGGDILNHDVDKLLTEIKSARLAKDYAKADEIRDQIDGLGYKLTYLADNEIIAIKKD